MNIPATSISSRIPRKLLILSLVLTLFLSGCYPARQSRRMYRISERSFYMEQSRLLGFELTGRENPFLLAEVSSWLGTPYRLGGSSRRGVDCSGLAAVVYHKVFDYQLPRQAADMAKVTRRVRKGRLQEGNLVFFRNQSRQITHVGIYLGQGYFVHSSSTRGVIVSHLDEPYFNRMFAYGGRVR